MLNTLVKLLYEYKTISLKYSKIYVDERNRLEIFNKNIQMCQYEYKANQYCLNTQKCTEKKKTPNSLFFQNYITYQIDCKCSQNKMFKCGQYCTIDSFACDYLKSINSKQFVFNITKCRNQKETFKSFFTLW
jgi:hypothetical protein